MVEYTYDSWGKILSTAGTLATTLGENQPFRYRGYVYDRETQWYYLQSRYYDPTTGRFISADVYLSTGQGVLGHNSFAYCNSNPINMVDPEGGMAFGTLVHEAIENYMIQHHICGVIWYPNVHVDKNRFGLGKNGWVDLVDQYGGAYEIKPGNNPVYCYFGKKQLENYCNASLKGRTVYPEFTKLHVGTLSFSGQVTVGNSIVEFVCNGDGIIRYYEIENRVENELPVPLMGDIPGLLPHSTKKPNAAAARNESILYTVGAIGLVFVVVGFGGGSRLNVMFNEGR